MAAAHKSLDNGAARLREIVGQVYKRVDATLCRDQSAEFRELALNLLIVCQRADRALVLAQRGGAAFAPAYEYDALLMFPEMVELLLRLGRTRASTGASSPRPTVNRTKALKLFAQKKAASPKKSDKTIKAAIRRELNVHRSTVARWFPDKPTQ